MAVSKALVVSLFISVFILHLVQADDVIIGKRMGRSLLQNIDCVAACDGRCMLSSRPHLCLRACNTCCRRCNCVPRGTSGNEDVCPCYANMTTHGGRHKCP